MDSPINQLINSSPTSFFVIFLIIMLIGLLFWIVMLIDCVTKESSTGNDKLIWVLIILFAHILGALLYMFIRRPQRIRELGS